MDCQEGFELFYYPDTNHFEDGFGSIIYNIFAIISPATLYAFKLYKESMLAWTVDGGRVAMFYEECEEDYQ
jgi:hypothetical protein